MRPEPCREGKFMSAFLYMLLCSDGSLYVGCATGDDLTKRVAEHNTGFYRGYTYTRRPVRLIWSEHFPTITDANAAERQVKGWSRAKKIALAKGEWSRVRSLAKRRAGRPLPASPS
jgi:putative endonuclease